MPACFSSARRALERVPARCACARACALPARVNSTSSDLGGLRFARVPLYITVNLHQAGGARIACLVQSRGWGEVRVVRGSAVALGVPHRGCAGVIFTWNERCVGGVFGSAVGSTGCGCEAFGSRVRDRRKPVVLTGFRAGVFARDWQGLVRDAGGVVQGLKDLSSRSVFGCVQDSGQFSSHVTFSSNFFAAESAGACGPPWGHVTNWLMIGPVRTSSV